jgi:hypothetical protein
MLCRVGFFSRCVEAQRIALRSFQMQLSKKTAMLFFLYLNAAFTSQTEIPGAVNTSDETIRAPENDPLGQFSGRNFRKIFW